MSSSKPYQEGFYNFFTKTRGENLFAEQGEVFSYSNDGFSLAGLVLSTLTKMQYDDAIGHYITKPLEMYKATFNLEEVVAHSFATGHARQGGEMKPATTGIPIGPAVDADEDMAFELGHGPIIASRPRGMQGAACASMRAIYGK